MTKLDFQTQALMSYMDGVSRFTEGQFEVSQATSWGILGHHVCLGLEIVCKAKPENLNQAKLTLELGAGVVLLFWYGVWEYQQEQWRNLPDKDKALAKRISLSNVQTMLGIDNEDNIDLYIDFGKVYELKRTWTHASLLVLRYAECLRGEQLVDWKQLAFPDVSTSDVLSAPMKELNALEKASLGMDASMQLQLYVAALGGAMWGLFTLMMREKLNPENHLARLLDEARRIRNEALNMR